MVYAAILCAIALGKPTNTPPSAMASKTTDILRRVKRSSSDAVIRISTLTEIVT
jgi:hypothetical protein